MNIRSILRGGMACATAVATIALCVPAAAFADVSYDDTSHVTVAACRAAEPVADILGADNVEGVNPFQDYTSSASATDGAANHNMYTLFASGITGSNDVYKSNLLTWYANGNTTYPDLATCATNKIVFVPQETLRNGSGGGPNKPFDTSNAYDVAFLEAMQPDVVVGDGGSNAGGTGTITTGDNYSGLTASWVTGTTAQILVSTSAVASQIDAAATSAKPARYGSAIDIAENLTSYVNAINNYAASVEAAKSTHTTIAVVTNVDSEGNCTLGTASTVGTSTNRYVEVLQNVITAGAVLYSSNATTVPATDVFEDNDFVIFGGAQGTNMGTYVTSGTPVYYFYRALSETQKPLFPAHAFYTNTTGAGSMYGTVMNSVENMQNYGRILPFIYRNADVGFTPDTAMTYWVREFYHVDGANAITNAMHTLYGTGPSSVQYVYDSDGCISYASTTAFEDLLDDWA